MTRARDIIVIGASAGGIEALSTIASGLPADFPAAIMIVLHTSPASPRALAGIIGRNSGLVVTYGTHGDAIEPGHAYIAPPDHHLVVAAPGCLHLNQEAKENFSRPAVDPLFRSAAAVYGPRVIGVVLTGGDGDGTKGLRAIKAAGGVSIVQNPEEAERPGMPLSALLGDSPDYKLSLDDITQLLIRLAGGGAA